MKKSFFIAILFLIQPELPAQSLIRTIVPEKKIFAGEPFRIQFVIQNSKPGQKFIAPGFNGLKIIRGPEQYEGYEMINDRRVQLINYIFTAVAEKPGTYKIGSPKLKLADTEFTGNEAMVIADIPVTKNQTGDYSGTVLLPGEDPVKKIRDNLYVKLLVDRKTCYVGEPVVATFKLYSRLQSHSAIVRNPGFYGFSIYDMLNLEDKVKETETINGKDFDVHTIRKVQLYPLQAGQFPVDEMQIENKVEFTRNELVKKTEQEITEGVHDDPESKPPPGIEIYKTNLHTESVVITVLDLPVKNKPANFGGAAGQFSIRTKLSKEIHAKNEEGYFEIILEGKGNFIQLTPPVINWPAGLENFEPSVKDFIDKRLVPLSGARIFRFPFISAQPGKWMIPAVPFSFFNIANRQYETLFTDSFYITVADREFEKTEIQEIKTETNKITIEEANRKVSRIAFVLVAILFFGAFAYWFFGGNKKEAESVNHNGINQELSPEEIFYPLVEDEDRPDKEFYSAINRLCWKLLAEKYHLSGTGLNKNQLAELLARKGNDSTTISALINLLHQFESAMYTDIGSRADRKAVAEEAIRVMQQLKG